MQPNAKPVLDFQWQREKNLMVMFVLEFNVQVKQSQTIRYLQQQQSNSEGRKK